MPEIRDRTFEETSSSGSTFEGNVIVSKVARDNGAGGFNGTQFGAVSYNTGVITIKPTDPYTIVEWERSTTGGTTEGSPTGGTETESTLTQWRKDEQQDSWGSGSVVRVRFQQAGGTPTAQTETLPAKPIVLRLTPYNAEGIVPGSLAFFFAGHDYVDRDGTLVAITDRAQAIGIPAGSVNYKTGEATITAWGSGFDVADEGGLFVLWSMLTTHGEHVAENAFFRAAGSPLRPASLYVQVVAEDGELLTGFADQSGNISGDHMRGKVEQEMGVVYVQFGELVAAEGNEGEPWFDEDDVVAGMIWRPRLVIPSTLRYNAVVLSNLPLNADILGLDPVRLPADGRVPVFRPGDVAVVHHTGSYELPDPAVAGATYAVGRTDLAGLWLVDASGAKISREHYTADLAAGTVTMAADLDLGSITQPLQAKHRIEQMVMLADVQINGQMAINAPIAREFPEGSHVSGALLFGDVQAQATGLFDQVTWTGEWSDQRIGSQAAGEFNVIDYPIEVLNEGAVTERWRLNFTSATTFQIVGESLGVIGTGATNADVAPVNPLTGKTYFVMRADGFGGGWANGNVIRFNTRAASTPIWIARTVLPGAALAGDSFDLQLRGDVDD